MLIKETSPSCAISIPLPCNAYLHVRTIIGSG